MGWEVYILLHALFSALQTLQFRAIARVKSSRQAGLAVNALAFSALYICGLLTLPLFGKVVLEDFLRQWQLFSIAAVLFVVALYFMYKALSHLESATASVLGTSSALFVVLIAGIIYGERLTSLQIAGIAIVLPCIWYVLALARRRHKFIDFKDSNWVQGFWFMMLSSFCLACAHVIEKDILQETSLGTYIAYGWLMQVICAWLLFLVFGYRSRKILLKEKVVRSALQLGALRAATGLFFLLALAKSNNVSLVTVVANFRIIIVAILAGWLLNERRFYYRKLAAAAVAVVGLSIIFWN